MSAAHACARLLTGYLAYKNNLAAKLESDEAPGSE